MSRSGSTRPDARGRGGGRSWSHSRRIGWAIDRGTPAPDLAAAGLDAAKPPSTPPVLAATLAHGRLVAEREALAAVVPIDPGLEYSFAKDRLRGLEIELHELDKGDDDGVWRGTEVGAVGAAWASAHREWRTCSAGADHATSWRETLKLRRQADRAAEREIPLRERFAALAAPERARLQAELPEAKAHLGGTRRPPLRKPALPDQTPRGPAAPGHPRRPDRHHRL
ncbi:MAG: hypothetical protein M3256_09805 [Actinomycetota bacterium]|nr:hypothetical protein [Actinomycetota bacterium]